ncbi:MAG: hypothetical protein ACM3SY_18185 [Candidatus Omnitrophota bacterium]
MNGLKIILVFVLMFLSGVAIAQDDNPMASPGSETEVLTIWEVCPWFVWPATDQAAAYRLALFETTGDRVSPYADIASKSSPFIRIDTSGSSGSPSWKLPSTQSLKNGGIYVWYTRALDASGKELGNWSNGRMFKVEQRTPPTPILIPAETIVGGPENATQQLTNQQLKDVVTALTRIAQEQQRLLQEYLRLIAELQDQLNKK